MFVISLQEMKVASEALTSTTLTPCQAERLQAQMVGMERIARPLMARSLYGGAHHQGATVRNWAV